MAEGVKFVSTPEQSLLSHSAAAVLGLTGTVDDTPGHSAYVSTYLRTHGAD